MSVVDFKAFSIGFNFITVFFVSSSSLQIILSIFSLDFLSNSSLHSFFIVKFGFIFSGLNYSRAFFSSYSLSIASYSKT